MAADVVEDRTASAAELQTRAAADYQAQQAKDQARGISPSR